MYLLFICMYLYLSLMVFFSLSSLSPFSLHGLPVCTLSPSVPLPFLSVLFSPLVNNRNIVCMVLLSNRTIFLFLVNIQYAFCYWFCSLLFFVNPILLLANTVLPVSSIVHINFVRQTSYAKCEKKWNWKENGVCERNSPFLVEDSITYQLLC